LRVLVLGAGGMAGHVITLYLRQNGFTVDTLSGHIPVDKDTQIVDVQNLKAVKKALGLAHYDVVINCISLLVKESEQDKSRAIYINAYFPKFLEEHYNNSDTKLIHISTNGVFSGKNHPYQEVSFYDGETFYGRTKALGEINNNKDLTLRTSIIGPELTKHGKSLFHWFHTQTSDISGYTSSLWSGLTTIEMARAIELAIEQQITGVYHLVPNEKISKYELLKIFKDTFHKKISINPVSGDQQQDMTITNTRTDFNYQPPPYKTMVKQMQEWMKGHKELYGHYEEA
jgi:dTDP-4-dehydrorhamnose reductase